MDALFAHLSLLFLKLAGKLLREAPNLVLLRHRRHLAIALHLGCRRHFFDVEGELVEDDEPAMPNFILLVSATLFHHRHENRRCPSLREDGSH